jgi:hypothetical protein
MTIPVYYRDDRQFQEGGTVRSYDSDERCVVLGRWRDWLWLDPSDCRNASQLTARTYDYYVVKSAEPSPWPNR